MTHCPHCSGQLERWMSPPDSSWGGAVQMVCFNDECPYYIKGWAWMMERYEVRASYRFRYDPVNHTQGPLPVWSPDAHRAWIDNEQGE